MDNYIKVISARDIYHHAYDMNDWKKNVFRNDISKLVDMSDQIISFGDAYYEFSALISLHELVPRKKHLKNVKLLQSPTFDSLLDQINVINNNFDDIIKHDGHLDINFAKL